MKLVIDIPKNVYKACKEKMDNGRGGLWLEAIIAKGTPLPKGHGELIDKNVVLDMMNYGILEEYITEMDGIIPADTRGEEDEADN